jgi:hypothetical protein
MDPAVTAAIIGAVSTAASTAASSAASAMAGESWISGTFINRTNYSFAVKPNTGAPAHGHWRQTPTNVIGVTEFFDLTKAQGKLPDLDAEKEIKLWAQQQVLSHRVNNFFSLFSLVGDGDGMESLAVFHSTSEPGLADAHIACYLRKRPGGYYWAGVSLSNEGWIGASADGYGYDLIDHIENIHTDLCRISWGDRQTVTMGSLKVSFTGGQQVFFEVDRA